ncbi:TPA: hypothetical protein ACYLN4_000583 [Burkholderia lata]
MNRKEHLLTILGEECAEIAFDASNALPDGLDNIEAGQHKTNAQLLGYEVIDLLAVVEMLEESRIIFVPISRDVIDSRKAEIRHFTSTDLLVAMIRSCSLISKNVAKALRFGLDDAEPGQSLTNARRIEYELVLFLAVTELLETAGILDLSGARELIENKKAKVLRFMKYAAQRGTLIDHADLAAEAAFHLQLAGDRL